MRPGGPTGIRSVAEASKYFIYTKIQAKNTIF